MTQPPDPSGAAPVPPSQHPYTAPEQPSAPIPQPTYGATGQATPGQSMPGVAPQYGQQPVTPGQMMPQMAPPPKKKPWLIPVIIIVVLAVIGSVIAIVALNSGESTYCETYIRVSRELETINADLTSASNTMDFPAMTEAIDDMLSKIEELQDADPPVEVQEPLETLISYLTDMRTFTESGGTASVDIFTDLSAFTSAGAELDNFSIPYCT